MRVLYFAPVPSEGASLPTASTLRDALNYFAPVKLIDSSITYGIDSWHDLLANQSMMTNAYDAVLLCAPRMKKRDRATFFDNLNKYTNSPLAKPVIGYFSDIDVQTPFNLLKAGAVYAHRSCEHVGVLSVYLARAATNAAPINETPPPYVMGPVVIDYAQHKAFVDGAPAKLTTDQFDMLSYLSRRNGRPCTKEALLDALDKHADIQEKLIDVVVCKIRASLSAANPDYPDAGDRTLRTMWGSGYFVVSKQADYDAPVSAKKGASTALLSAPRQARIA